MTFIRVAPALALAGLLGACSAQGMGSTASSAQMSTVTVGGQTMYPNKDIVDNAVNSADNTTLVAAVKAAGLVQALKGPGPLTVFAPTNEAFAALPPGTVNTLLLPQNKGTLTAVLTYHVVPGRLDYAALSNLIMQGGGSAQLKTLNGATLTASMNGPHNIILTDDKGGVAHISIYDVYQSNGVIQVIDRVMMP
jgi:uncharacterized surface protein with fasciclin (FAS1) repeats